MPKFGGAPKCARCAKSVYAVEKVLCAGRIYHKKCMTCKGCKTGLYSGNALDAENEIWCKACHGKSFGPKGYGFGGGAGILQMSEKVIPSSKPSKPVEKPAAKPEKKLAESSTLFCKKCNVEISGKFCTECGSKGEPKPVVTSPKPSGGSGCPSCAAAIQPGAKFCTSCGERLAVVKAPVSTFSKLSVGSVNEGKVKTKKKKNRFGGAPKCKRCGKSVYHAEKALAAGFTWHKACLRCKECNKGLSSNNITEAEGDIFCRAYDITKHALHPSLICS